MESNPTVDELISRWRAIRQENPAATIDDLCSDGQEESTELKSRLEAIASMMAFLGLEPKTVARLNPTLDDAQAAGAQATIAQAPDPSRPGLEAESGMLAVPGYQIYEELGRGGMGVVYKARQRSLDRIVAIKMILSTSLASPKAVERFLNEARTLALLKHPHVVQVYESGSHGGKPFLSLEYLDGGSLSDRLKGEPQPPAQAAVLLRQLALAVQAAHDKGIVHRDLKPGNVLLTRDQIPKITDFGLARQGESSMTMTGEVLGTPSYMAPEQAAGQAKLVGPAADIYALGAILYELLTGRPPFKGASPLETVQLVTSRNPVTPCDLQPATPYDLETICMKCLEKNPLKRYASAADLAADLDRYLAGKPIVARPVGRLERAWRWCLRNRALAASLAAIACTLVIATVVSLGFALRAEQALQAEYQHGLAETQAKQDALEARQRVQEQLVDLSAESGLTAAAKGDHTLALLWFARTNELSREDQTRQELSRIRYGNWLRSTWNPEGVWSMPGFRQDRDQFRIFELSPDGRYLLAAKRNSKCFVWDCALSRPAPLDSALAESTAGAWAPGTGQLALAGSDSRIHILEHASLDMTEEIPAEGAIECLAFDAGGRRLAWGGSRGARVWDRAAKAFVTPLLDHGATVATLAFSSDGGLLATSARDARARVFAVGSAAAQPLFSPVPHVLAEYAINHGGADRVAPRFANGDAVLLTVEPSQGMYNLQWRSSRSGAIVRTTPATDGHFFLSAFRVNATGTRVAAAWSDGRVVVLDAATGAISSSIPTTESYWVEDLAFTAGDEELALGTHGMRVEFWRLDEASGLHAQPGAPFVPHTKQVVRFSLARDGKRLAAALWDGTVCFWRAPTGPPGAFEFDAGGPTWLAVSGDQNLFLPRGASFRSGTLLETQVRDAASGKPVSGRISPGGIVVDAAFAPARDKLAIAALTSRTPQERKKHLFEPDGKAGNLQIWDWKQGKRLFDPTPLPAEPRGITYRPDGGSIAVVCADYRVVTVDPATGAIQLRLDPGIRTKPSDANLWTTNGSALYSSDNHFLLTWESPPIMHVWDAASGQLIQALEHGERIENAAFNPRLPHILATGGRDSMLSIWDLQARKLLARFQHPRWVQKIEFSPDGTELICGCSDGLIRSWNWRTGHVNLAITVNAASIGMAFTSDRRWLISGGRATLELFDWRTGSRAAPEWNLSGVLRWGVSCSDQDHRVLVGSYGGLVTGFDLKAMTTPSTAPAEDLTRLAELVAGRRILSEGHVIPLNTEEWTSRLRVLENQRRSTTHLDAVKEFP